MARINSHINYGAEYKNASAEARNSERVAEVNRNLTDLKSDILRLKIMVQAMMVIMVEQGIDPERINAKIDEVVSRPETFDPTMRASMPCSISFSFRPKSIPVSCPGPILSQQMWKSPDPPDS